MVFTTVIYLRFLSVTIPIFVIGNYYKIKELFQDEKLFYGNENSASHDL